MGGPCGRGVERKLARVSRIVNQRLAACEEDLLTFSMVQLVSCARNRGCAACSVGSMTTALRAHATDVLICEVARRKSLHGATAQSDIRYTIPEKIEDHRERWWWQDDKRQLQFRLELGRKRANQ